MISKIRIKFLKLVKLITNLFEDISNRLRFYASYPRKKRITWFYIQFYSGNTGAILSAVMLLFHKEIHLIQSPKNRAIFLLIVGERLAKPDKGETTFVFYCITHLLKEAAKLNQTMLDRCYNYEAC